jgi:competence protein ComER
MIRYGFIGTGSIGGMLIRKFIDTGAVAAESISGSSRTGDSAMILSQETGIHVPGSNRAVAESSDILFICVKPLQVRDVLLGIRDLLGGTRLIVSVAGCVTLDNLGEWSGYGGRCVKVIPSLTAEQNSGVSLIAWGSGMSGEDRALILSLFTGIGKTVEVCEEDLELYADLTSCAPALISAMMSEFAAAAVRTGTIKPEMAEFLVRETMIGTSRILADTPGSFDDVIRRVATKGGITEEGITVLHNRLPAVLDDMLSSTLAKHQKIKDQIARGGSGTFPV